MNDLKDRLISTGMIEDNEYLDLYIDLINRNKSTEKQEHKTQSHHIIPKCYYNIINEPVDNSSDNLVNLLYKDHVLAHYYLSLCSIGKLHEGMEFAMILISNIHKQDIDDGFIGSLDKYQELYEENMQLMADNARKRFAGITQSSDHIRKRVEKNTGQKRTEETKRKISESQKGKKASDQARENMRIAQQKYAMNETKEHRTIRVVKFKETMSNKSDDWWAEYRTRLSNGITGRPLGENECLNKSIAMKGKPKSEQHKIELARSKSKYVYYYNDILFQSEKEMLEYLKEQGVEITSHRLRSLADGKGKYIDLYLELVGKIKKIPNPRVNSKD